MEKALQTKLLQTYSDLHLSLAGELPISAQAERWEGLVEDLKLCRIDGRVPSGIAQVALAVGESVSCILESLAKLDEEASKQIGQLQTGLQSTLRAGAVLKPKPRPVAEAVFAPVENQGARELVVSRGNGRPRETQCAQSMRHWFLTHLPYPYPTYTEKRNLALQAGIPMSKIDSDLTNWRRRSGWGEICEVYARKSKDRMKMLMLRVQRGEETRPDLLEKVEGIRRYMDKECDKVGDWVHESRGEQKADQQLASFARPEKRPKLDHASPTNTTPHYGSHRSFSSVSSSSSLSDISALAAMEYNPSDAHTRDSPPTRSVSGSSTLSDASNVACQGPKRSMSFTDDVEQVANRAKISHTPLRAEPTWAGSPTEYASSDTSGFSGTYVSLDAASNSVSSFTASSESSLPSSEGDAGQPTGADLGVGSATAVSKVLTVANSIMDSECSSIWSTELELPSLPHMHSGSASSWRIPTLSEFRPEIGRWVERG